MNTVVIVQARMGSTRLPGKGAFAGLDVPLLQFQLERLKEIPKVDSIVVATTTNPADDLIVTLCKSLDFLVFRGAQHDVLDRYYKQLSFMKQIVLLELIQIVPSSIRLLCHEYLMYFTQNWVYMITFRTY